MPTLHPYRTFLVMRNVTTMFRVKARNLRHALDKVMKIFLKRPDDTDILTDLAPLEVSATIEYADRRKPCKLTIIDIDRLPAFRRLEQVKL